MKCVICHSPEIELKEVKEEICNENDVFIVPVKALVCQQCGERYYDRRTMRYLEELEKKIQNKTLQFLPVGKVYKTELPG